MNNLNSLLQKFRTKLSEGKQLDTVVSQAISYKTGVAVELQNLSVREGVIRLALHPALKQEIILKKKIILDFINTHISGYTIIDLR